MSALWLIVPTLVVLGGAFAFAWWWERTEPRRRRKRLMREFTENMRALQVAFAEALLPAVRDASVAFKKLAETWAAVNR